MNTENLELRAAESALRDSTEQAARSLEQLRHKFAHTGSVVRWPQERLRGAGRWLEEKLTPEDRRMLPRVAGGAALLWLAGRLLR